MPADFLGASPQKRHLSIRMVVLESAGGVAVRGHVSHGLFQRQAFLALVVVLNPLSVELLPQSVHDPLKATRR